MIIEKKSQIKQSYNKRLKPTEEDWNIILKGSRVFTFEANEVVIKEGEKVAQLYQIQSGGCKAVQKQNPDLVLASIGPEDKIFGERSFLEGGKATVSMITTQPTRVTVIEAYFLNILIQYYPALTGRFFHYISAVLARRALKKSSLL